jgi:hypothetical protein
MSAAPVLLYDSAESQLDDLLSRVCEEIQLSPTRHQQAVDRYMTVCEWLEAEGPVASFKPSLYPQGSMRIGTTNKPVGRDEFDLDFVCEFLVSPTMFSSPMQLLKLLESRLLQHKTYAAILELKNRCIRLNYANEFHMDILPACSDHSSGSGCLVVPDRETRWWKHSNPKGYAAWFDQCCQLAIQVTMAERARIIAKAEPVPEQEIAAEKAILKRVVQLLKRWRDLHYARQCEVAPISMVLTTLAASCYRGQRSTSRSLTDILAQMVAMFETAKPRIYVPNPANPKEDLSERWDDREHYAAFVTGIRGLHRDWTHATGLVGMQHVANALEKLFGEPVKTALAKQANRLHDLRGQSALRVTPAGLITAAPAISVPMRPNTFHGK